ncbi:Dynein assembly factor 1 [Phytophthora citrophthora]|uniref:Dynein assembly factor 1 n=1 Tax=Phytophthora citrophthora TaxID=4793 RepID=A0AAD9LL51_9STRA|nr:Dynein assembly factor 1 [Phytophthora citrophthora]
MLGGIFHKRKKNQELRNPSLQDIKKFRDTYAKYAELRQVETPPCFEKVKFTLGICPFEQITHYISQSIYKVIAGQKELHTIEFRQEDITDPQIIALAEALLEMPMISSLDLRDNRITDDGAKALLEVLRLQIISAKTPPTVDPRTKQPLYPPLPEYTRYVTSVNVKGNEVSASVLQELSQYIDVLRREDKRLEIRVALSRIDRNSDGGIDEEEFKGVLKLLTATTPTKKEIRTFMQQHTLSTDSTQNAVNLENVLLAKCAVSPSRNAASPPWEALVQERHAILGAPRMVPTRISTVPDPSDTTTRHSRHSVPSSGSELETGKTNSFNSFSDISPVSSPSYQVAPVVPIEAVKPPPPPFVTGPAPAILKISEAKSSTDQPVAFSKPPTIPALPLASLVQHTSTVNPSPRSARSTGDEDWHRNPSLTSPNSVISAPSSPHDSDISDNMSIVSSAFGGSISHRFLDDEQTKPHTTSTVNPATSNLDSPRWQSDNFMEIEAISAVVGTPREDTERLSIGEVEDDVRSSVLSHKSAKPITGGSELDAKSASTPSIREASFPGNETPRELLSRGSEYSSAVQEEKRSPPGNVVSTPRFDDLSSLVFRGAEDGGQSFSNAEVSADQPEDDEGDEECVDSLVVDVMKDGKERSIVKLTHSEFRTGLTVKDFPVELSFRNVLALLLSDNGLSHLELFAGSRFPFVTVLDLSRNKLMKLPEDGLSAFPRLEVLNLAKNQLKSIGGLSKIFKLRALGLQQNSIRSVKNVEHLVQLEVLDLAHNQIATVHALRLLSLNKGLTHLHLEGNPVVETDERQKRKNIVHVRNLLPALQSLDSVPCVNLSSKDKKKANSVSTGKCLFESELIPDYKTLWVATACDNIQVFQDASSHNSSQSQQDDDEWDTREEDGEDRPKKPLTREQQRQKDELRSRAIGFRSRGKAIPSPAKVKTSAYSFGPSQPPTVRTKKKKPTPADPSVVREQQRRASELSAPKYTPVDQTMMNQEKKRKSRVDFHQAMTVGERLQLAMDITQRRPTVTVLSARSRSILAKAESRKRASVAETVKEEVIEEEDEESLTTADQPPRSPRTSPLKDAMVFRIDPVDTPRSPKGILTFRVDPYPEGSTNCSKEGGFLHDLAVSDFLNHAEEEFSTALTALNVLLSMCEKEQGDPKKLMDYRASLDALDILNESESNELYKKAQDHSDNELQTQCSNWFTKLGVVKKCMRQLLEKLEGHAPGSGVIRAYCRCLRSNELRGIITTTAEDQEEALNQPSAGAGNIKEVLLESEPDVPQTAANDLLEANLQQDEQTSDSSTSRSIEDSSTQALDERNSGARTPDSVTEPPTDNRNTDFSIGDDLDFLEPTDSVFTEDYGFDMAASDSVSQCMETTTSSLTADKHTSGLESEMDITMDIQINDVVDSNQSAAENLWETTAGEDNGDTKKSSVVIEDESTIEKLDEAIAIVDTITDNDDQVAVDEITAHVESEEPDASNEDYDWLATSTEVQDESAEADTFKQDLITVSGDEADDNIGQEQTDSGQDFDWPSTHTTEAPNEEEVEVSQEAYNGEEAEVSQEIYNGEEEAEGPQEVYNGEEEVEISHETYEAEVYEAEESNDVGEAQENVEYSEEVATEEMEETGSQFELGDGVDADDEEAETFGDWEKGFDPNSNHYFWFNHNTGESSWTPPEGWPHEVDEPFSGEDAGTEEEQQEQEYVYEEGTAEAQEYEETGTGDQANEEGATEGQYYEEGAYEHGEGTEEGQYYEEGTNDTQYYEEGAEEQVYEEATPEEQQYDETATDGQWYDETAAEEQEYEEQQYEEQQYEEQQYEEQQYDETATDGQWYDETAAEEQEYVEEDGEQVEQQTGEESPCRSETSDFEFDDSDLPGF